MTQYTDKEIFLDDSNHYWCTCTKDYYFSYLDPDAKGDLVFKKNEKYKFFFEDDGIRVWVYFPDSGGLTFSVKTEKYLNIFTDYFEYDIHIKSPRQAKLDRIEKNSKRSE